MLAVQGDTGRGGHVFWDADRGSCLRVCGPPQSDSATYGGRCIYWCCVPALMPVDGLTAKAAMQPGIPEEEEKMRALRKRLQTLQA